MHQERGLLAGFRHARNGFMWAAGSQINMRVHLVALVLVILLGFFLKINYTEWLIVVVVSVTMLVLELVNTSLEQAMNAISTEFNPFIKRAKDVSAAAVLVYAIGALVIGLIIFGSKL
ncbi:MAG: diacylglycerol kinase family protein [Patescibacteria group bacterium]